MKASIQLTETVRNFTDVLRMGGEVTLDMILPVAKALYGIQRTMRVIMNGQSKEKNVEVQ